MNEVKRALSLDQWMDYSPRSGGGAYLKSWKDDGELLAWLHPEAGVVPFFNHPVPRVHEIEKDGEKELKIWSDRWGCHENEEVLKRQNFRRKDGIREMPPVFCPGCLLIEWVYQKILEGRVNWLQPLFRWDAGGEELVVVAGGMYNAFRSKDITRQQKAEMRRANIRGDEAWKQDMRARLQYLFHVVDDAHPDRGVQKAFEGQGLGSKIQKAIRDEMTRSGREAGNPSTNPYPFRWEYDSSKDFDEKYNVIAMSNRKPSPEIERLLKSQVQPFDLDVAPGDCWALRANLEEHAVGEVEIPWDRIFAGAEKRGLMKPAQESKADRGGDATDFDPKEVEAQQKGEPARKQETVEVGEDHPVWSDETWKPAGPLKGSLVLLCMPDHLSSDDFDEVRELFEKAGATVGEIVACEHCGERMTTLDDVCPSCGATYSAEGKLTGRPCVREGCGGVVALGKEGERAICGKCATIHEMADGKWMAIVPVPPAEKKPDDAPPPRRRRGQGVPFDRQG
jgi:hypothetical protein